MCYALIIVLDMSSWNIWWILNQLVGFFLRYLNLCYKCVQMPLTVLKSNVCLFHTYRRLTFHMCHFFVVPRTNWTELELHHSERYINTKMMCTLISVECFEESYLICLCVPVKSATQMYLWRQKNTHLTASK